MPTHSRRARGVGDTIDEIEAVLLRLPPSELHALMDRVAARRGMSPAVESTWIKVAKQRMSAYDAGGVELIPMEETLAKLRAIVRG